ncbi:MAG: hypothetical protein OXF98_01795 [Rhodospirillaceae bacterium]|nr:hypothetical protein [Rhodospirillaceae bacterium]
MAPAASSSPSKLNCAVCPAASVTALCPVQRQRDGLLGFLRRVATHAGHHIPRHRRPSQPLHRPVVFPRQRRVVDDEFHRGARCQVGETRGQGALLRVGDDMQDHRQLGIADQAVHRADQLSVVDPEGPRPGARNGPARRAPVQRRFGHHLDDPPGGDDLSYVAGAETVDDRVGEILCAIPARPVAHRGREIHDDHVQPGGLRHEILNLSLQRQPRKREGQQHQHADPQRKQQQVLQFLGQHAPRLARLQEHDRAEGLTIRILRGQPVQPDRNPDRQQAEQKCGREQRHHPRLCRNKR